MFVHRFARTSSTIHYGPTRIQAGRLTLASTAVEPQPVVMFLHGGFWRWPYGRWLMRRLVADTNRRGWHAYNVSYRRLGRFGGGGGWPQTFDDVASALDALTDQVASLADSWDRRVAVVGHSAGGHLALICAARRPRSMVGVISVGGPTDLRSLGTGPHGGDVGRLVSGAPDSDRWSLTSPVEMVPIGTPIRLIHGALDSAVPQGMVRHFAERARAAGDDVSLTIVPDEHHRDVLRSDSQSWLVAVRQLEQWFDATRPTDQEPADARK